MTLKLVSSGDGAAPVPSGGPGLGAAAWTFVPAALLGTCCGLAVFRRLTDRQFATAINALLIASGVGITFWRHRPERARNTACAATLSFCAPASAASATRPGRYVAPAVADKGPGMPGVIAV